MHFCIFCHSLNILSACFRCRAFTVFSARLECGSHPRADTHRSLVSSQTAQHYRYRTHTTPASRVPRAAQSELSLVIITVIFVIIIITLFFITIVVVVIIIIVITHVCIGIGSRPSRRCLVPRRQAARIQRPPNCALSEWRWCEPRPHVAHNGCCFDCRCRCLCRCFCCRSYCRCFCFRCHYHCHCRWYFRFNCPCL